MRTSVVVLLLTIAFGVSVAEERLKVDLYVESLCPYSRWLVATVFASIFENGLDESMEFRVFFAGNTREKEGKLVCQHGEQECYLNKVIGCAIARKSSAKEWFPLVNCIEIQGRLAAKNATLDECASKVGLAGPELVACAMGEEGEKIHRQAHNATQALEPPHRWVPWGVINGAPVYDDIYNLQDRLCNIAPLEQRPKVCYEPTTKIKEDDFHVSF